MFEKMNGV